MAYKVYRCYHNVSPGDGKRIFYPSAIEIPDAISAEVFAKALSQKYPEDVSPFGAYVMDSLTGELICHYENNGTKDWGAL